MKIRYAGHVLALSAATTVQPAHDSYLAGPGRDERWRTQWFGQLRKSLPGPPEVLLLTPAARSLLR